MATQGSVIQFLLSQVRTSTEALIGGKVYFYSPGTTSTAGVEIWLNDDGTGAASNPYTLDADGTAQLYASGKYDVLIKDAAGVTQFDRKNVTFYNFDNPYEYDALQYTPFTFTQASIEAALTAIGTTNKVTLLLRPGTWVISSNADWSAYTNVKFKIVPGAVISHGAFTVKIPNVDAGAYQWESGTGLVTLTGIDVLRSVWFSTGDTSAAATFAVGGIPLWIKTAGTIDGDISGPLKVSLADTVNSNSGNQIISNVTASTINSNLVGGSDETFNSAYEAVKINSGTSTSVYGSIAVRLKKDAGVTAGNVYCRLYTDSGGVPDTPIGLIQGAIYAATIATTYSEHDLFFSAPGLTAGTNYWVVFTQYSLAGGNIYFDRTTGTAEHAYSATGVAGSWTTENKKLYYKLKGATYTGLSVTSDNWRGIEANSTNAQALRAVSVNGNGVEGYSTTGGGGYFDSVNSFGMRGVSTHDVGVKAETTDGTAGLVASTVSGPYSAYMSSREGQALAVQTGSLVATATRPTFEALRNLTLGIYDVTGPVLRAKDNTASTGDILSVEKGGNVEFKVASTGVITARSLAGAGSRAVNADANGVLSAASDERMKENFKPLAEEVDVVGLLKNEDIRATYYNWKDKKRGERRELGFTAQMFENEVPEITGEEGYDNHKYLDYQKLTAVLWEQNRILLKRIEALEKKVDL